MGTTDGATPERLDAFLSACERADSWRVVRTLKESGFETTELVEFEGARGGALGPYVRKRIDCSAGVGTAYEELWEAQGRGVMLRHVPRIVDCVRAGDELTVVLEFVAGPTLEAAVAAQGGSEALARDLFPSICDAVSELHERLPHPLIHRDLKPTNIIVRGDEPVVIDFGIARSWHEGAEADTTHFGTKAYAPPEQFGFKQTDERSDVYALGKLLLFCLTGVEPAVSSDEFALARLGVPAGYAQVIDRATSFDPAARYASARELKRAFVLVGANRSASQVASTGQVDASGDEPYSGSDAGRGYGRGFSSYGAGIAASQASVSMAAAHTAQVTARRSEGRGGLIARAMSFLARRVPQSVGRIWNILVLIVYAFFFVVCFAAALFPNEHDSAFPLWFLLLEYGTAAIVVFGGAAYLLLDKRRLFERYPALARAPLLRQLVLYIGISCVCILVITIIGMAAGLL